MPVEVPPLAEGAVAVWALVVPLARVELNVAAHAVGLERLVANLDQGKSKGLSGR